MNHPLPPHEAARLQELHALGLLDTPREAAFDELTRLAAELCEVPIAAVSLVDAQRQWFKAQCGLGDTRQTPRDQSFCAHAILRPDELLEVPDAQQDPRFVANPLVTGDPFIRFYAGAPLLSTRGQALGALCVIDRRPRALSEAQRRALQVLARQVGQLIELRRKRLQLEQQEGFLLAVIESLHEGVVIRDGARRLMLANASAAALLGQPLQDDIGRVPGPDPNSWRGEDGRPLRPEEHPAERCLRSGRELDGVITRLQRRDGRELLLEHNARPLRRNGQVDGVVLSFRDVSEQRATLQRLRDNEKRLRGITDNVPALIAYVDRGQLLRFANRTLLDWAGQEEAQVLDRPVAELLGPDEHAVHRDHILAALAGERREFGLWTAMPGAPRFIQFSYVPERCDNGQVQGFFVLASDLTAMKNLEIQLATEARFDALTGLPNRKHFHELLDQGLRRMQRHAGRLALGFLDLDGFKQINDRHGHAVGDLVLQEVGRRLQAALRRTDAVARLAGDEFTLLLEDLQQAHELEPLARKLLAALHETPFELPGLRLPVRASLGLALAESAESAEELLKRADGAMYRAKQAAETRFAIAE
ncbi:diguanylate cyclase [Roseateles sp. DAIF2]|uniref:sensor domain-containing diguanylate cyclase n=1 Tax=Roseateles sp. DAIF2 TaxID=2714952 RepID=UPI0018A2AD07|nr:diguanylate cyclase [Roseateles sp. DAIF2]QPF73056.1 diguanylate cyclase [Roseateles sp. DAIF2]